jgi:spectinomycin phosphotransferase
MDARGAAFFVTVDDLNEKDWLGCTPDEVYDGLHTALGLAAALRDDSNLEFVVAPIRGVDNQLVHRINRVYAASVYPFLVGQSYSFGPYTDASQRRRVLDMLVALHSATPAMCRIARPLEPTVGRRLDLEQFLQQPHRPWAQGPLSEPGRTLIASCSSALARLLESFDSLVRATSAARSNTVITHGEPHPSNVMCVAGRYVVFDWDTAGLAAPERDLWLVVTDSQEIAYYSEASGRPVHPAVLTLYRLRWYLDDIASAVYFFRHSHGNTEDTRHWWQALNRKVEELPAWQEALS